MAATGMNIASEAFAFVEAIQGAGSPQELLRTMEAAFGAFGFEHFVIASLPRPGQSARQAIHIHQVPTQWYELYTRSNYIEHDPIVRHCRSTVQPFDWDEVPIDAGANPKAAEVMHRARDFRMERGFCLPVHGIDGFDGCISVSGRDVELDTRTRPAIHLMALYAYDRGVSVSNVRQPRDEISLSPREVEILSFSAHGLSASAIAAAWESPSAR